MKENWSLRIWPLLGVLITLVALWLAADWFNEEVLQPSLARQTHGFGAYYSAARLLANGEITADIYDPDYFRPLVLQDSQGQAEDIYNANPPTTALMLWPLASLPAAQAREIWLWLNVGFLVGGTGLLLWGFGVPLRNPGTWPLLFACLAISLYFQPLIQNVMLGQAYLLIFFLLSLSTAAFFKNHPTSGLALSLSLLLKTAGWPLLILFLWLRKGRMTAWAIGTAVTIFAGTLILFPLDMWLAYGRLLSQVGRSPFNCVPAYQTTRSWLCHLFAPEVMWQEANGIPIPPQATITLTILGLVFLLIILKLSRKRSNAAFIATICWSVLFLPLGEAHHHLVMLIPFTWVIVQGDKLSRLSQLLVILAACFYLLEFNGNNPNFQSGYKALLAYPYLAGAWLLFLSILWDQRQHVLPNSFNERVDPQAFIHQQIQRGICLLFSDFTG